MTILIALIILLSCFKKPMFGMALLIQTNIIRSLVSINYSEPCFNCVNEPDIILGAITPIFAFVIILLRLELVRKLKYVIDLYDIFFVVSVITLFFTSLYSPDLSESLDYSFRFLFLGCSYFFITKIIVINTVQYASHIKSFLKYSLWLAIIFGTLGGVLYLFKGEGVYRMTIPGVHPIPFSQLIGLGIIVSFVIFITNGTFFNITSKVKLNINIGVLPYLVLLLFATNTRGVMLSTALAIVFYMILSRVKIKKRTLYISGGIMLLALIIVIQYIDYEVLFKRLLAKQTEKSFDDRFIAYTDSFRIFLENPLGIGPNAFKHYSILPYPHNFFLEFLSQYGIFGLFISIYFIFMSVYMFLITLKHGRVNRMFIILFILFIYFFIETMFSFTLWMHKGMFLTIGLFAGYYHRFMTRQANA